MEKSFISIDWFESVSSLPELKNGEQLDTEESANSSKKLNIKTRAAARDDACENFSTAFFDQGVSQHPQKQLLEQWIGLARFFFNTIYYEKEMAEVIDHALTARDKITRILHEYEKGLQNSPIRTRLHLTKNSKTQRLNVFFVYEAQNKVRVHLNLCNSGARVFNWCSTLKECYMNHFISNWLSLLQSLRRRITIVFFTHEFDAIVTSSFKVADMTIVRREKGREILSEKCFTGYVTVSAEELEVHVVIRNEAYTCKEIVTLLGNAYFYF
ncbi:hypothetical protein G9A89_010422 [Geosiphon pyriformis]|nr:hypothetical protein G9A89_010422 [Geosiphon pyriformis]